MLLLMPGVLALVGPVVDRGRRLACVAVVVTCMGAAGYGGGELQIGMTLPSLVRPEIPRPDAVAAYHAAQSDPWMALPFLLGLGAYMGLVLAGTALLRSGTERRWWAWILVVTPVVWFAGAVGPFQVGAALSVPVVVVFAVTVARRRGDRRDAATRPDPLTEPRVTAQSAVLR